MPIIVDTLGIVDKRSLVKDLPHVLKVKIKLQKYIMLNCYYMPERFNMNMSHQLFDYIHNNLCEFTALEHNFKRWFCTLKPILNVRFKDQHKFDSDLVWQIQLISINCIRQTKSESKIYIILNILILYFCVYITHICFFLSLRELF